MSATETKKPAETPGEWLRFATENLQVAERELTHDAPAYHTIGLPGDRLALPGGRAGVVSCLDWPEDQALTI